MREVEKRALNGIFSFGSVGGTWEDSEKSAVKFVIIIKSSMSLHQNKICMMNWDGGGNRSGGS